MTETATLPSGRTVTITEPAPSPDDLVWIAPRDGAAHAGLGTQDNPLRVAGPSEFDRVFGDRGGRGHFRLFPGEYETRGSWAFPQHGYGLIGGGSSLVGVCGSDSTVLRLEAPVTETDGQPRPRRDLNIAWFGRSYADEAHITVQGITFDGSGAPDGWTVSGPYVWGSYVTVRDIAVRAIRGDYSRYVEVFALALIGLRGGAHVRGVRCYGVAPSSYVSGISVGYTGTILAPSLVEDCDLDGAAGNHFALAACSSTVLTRVRWRGWKTGIYNDTGRAIGVLAVDCGGAVEYAAARLVRSLGEPKEMWRLLDCRFAYGSPAEAASGREFPWVGIALSSAADVPPLPWVGITAERCHFHAPARRPFALISNVEEHGVPVASMVDCVAPHHASLHLPKSAAEIESLRDANGLLFPNLPAYPQSS